MIVFDSVTKVYEPDVVALNDVSFHIDKGEFVFIVGASGSGKSTLVRLLLKELDPTSGKVVIGGRELGRLKPSKVPMLRRNIGCVFQDFKLLPRRTAAENVAYALKVQGESSASIRKKVPEVLAMVGLSHKIELPPRRAVGRRAAARLDRARVRQPPAAARLRRADRQPRPRHVGRDHAAALPHQPLRHDDPDGHPRPRDGRQDAQARDRARGRPARPRRAPRRLRVAVGGRIKLLVSEAWRSLGANLSTTVAATMTVLIGMFLLGLFIALGTWTVSWSNHVKKQLVVKVYFLPKATATAEGRPSRASSQQNQYVKPGGIKYVPKEQALAQMKKKYPELVKNLTSNPFPDTLEVTPNKAENVDKLYRASTLPQQATGCRQGPRRQAGLAPNPAGRARDRSGLHARDRRPADRVDPADREHDPPVDLLAAT